MGEPAMNIGPEELQKIGDYVRLHLSEWMSTIRGEREFDLIERSIRVEEELKAQREIMETRFDAMDKRFEAVDRRFEAMDKRFEAVQQQLDTRFEAMQKQIDVRFDAVEKRFNSLQWTMGLGFTLIAAFMGIFNFL